MKPLRIRIMLVDDHFIVRMGLIASLQTHPEFQIVAEAGRGDHAIRLYREHRPAVVLLDLRLPDLSGVEVAAQILREFPAAKIIILSSHDLEEEIFRAFQAGAAGYLIKDVSAKELAAAIQSVAGGAKHIPPEIARKLAEHSPGSDLTDRELEVLQMLVKGLNNKEIAKALGFSENTAKFHVKNLFTKLQVSERTEAVTMAFQRGIIR